MAIATERVTRPTTAAALYLRDIMGMAGDHSKSVHAAYSAAIDHVWDKGPEAREEGQDLINDLQEAALLLGARLGPVAQSRANELAEAWGGRWTEHFLNAHGNSAVAAGYLRPLFEEAGIAEDFEN